jgi:hypothetical protein
VATRYHHAILDMQSRAIASQVGFLIVLNLVLGISGVFGNVDNFAHVGGLLAGVWLALAMPPGRVPTLGSLWQTPGGGGKSQLGRLALPALGFVALVAVLVAGYVAGTSKWQADPLYRYYSSAPAPVATVTAGPQLLDLKLD